MWRLWRLVIANWWLSPGRALAAAAAVALGVGSVVITANVYETARRGIADEFITHWLGSAHVTVHPAGAYWGALDAALTEELAELGNIQNVSARLRRRLHMLPEREVDRLMEARWELVDAIGIRPQTERHFRALPGLQGRMFEEDESGVAVMEEITALEWGLRLDDAIALTTYSGGPRTVFRVVGLFASPRASEFQRPSVYVPLADLQEITGERGVVTEIDLKLHHPSPAAIETAKREVEQHLAELVLPYRVQVETGAARQLVLNEADRVTRLLLMLMAFISLLAAFFIILTTQTLSLFQRRQQLGILRCVGATRRQLAGLIFFELLPFGLIGSALGIIGGIVLTHGLARAASDVLIRVYLSTTGMQIAALCGVLTTVATALFLLTQVLRVQPLAAVGHQACAPRIGYIYLTGACGVALLGLHQSMVHLGERTRWLNEAYAFAGAGSLHLGYALLAPVAVVLLGRPIARGIGRLFGLRARLVEEPLIQAPWRSTAACWVLMIGLSLIIYIAIRAEGVRAIWDFPGRLPSAFVWSPKYMPGEAVERVRRLPGVHNVTVTTDVVCQIETEGDDPVPAPGKTIVERFLIGLVRPVFMAGDPDELLGMIKVVFTEGSQDEALAKLRRGGYVLIPPQTARQRNLQVGDRVIVTIGGQSETFEVAGVIQSPAMDLAVTAFQAESYMQLAAASSVLGTRRDLQEKFGIDSISMVMCDIDLAPSPVPDDFDPSALPDFGDDAAVGRAFLSWADHLPEETETFARIGPALEAWLVESRATPPADVRTELRRAARSLRRLAWLSESAGTDPQQAWETFREALVLLKIAEVMERPDAIMGSLRRLKEAVDEGLGRALVIVTWLPAVVLAVAALGIANLMMVSVYARTRQIGVLRAVGAQKSQIVWLVLAEAITLGLLGSVMGVALGVHEAHSVNLVAAGLIDVRLEFLIPPGTVAAAVLLTAGFCVAAAIVPARVAARENIINAMQSI